MKLSRHRVLMLFALALTGTCAVSALGEEEYYLAKSGAGGEIVFPDENGNDTVIITGANPLSPWQFAPFREQAVLSPTRHCQ